MPNSPNNNYKGIKIPAWAIAFITLVLVQMGSLVWGLASIKANQRHLQDSMNEVKFRVGNIGDDVTGISERLIKQEAKQEMLEEAVKDLEDVN